MKKANIYVANYSMIKYSIKKARKRNGKLYRTESLFLRRRLDLIKHLEGLLNEGIIVLDISDNEALAEILDCTPREAKRAKESLSKLGVIYVPEYGRQKKEGDYPIWHFNFKYLVKKVATFAEKKRASLLNKYNQAFKGIYNKNVQKLVNEIKDLNEYDRLEYGDTRKIQLSPAKFMVTLNMMIRDELDSLGTTRADYLI